MSAAAKLTKPQYRLLRRLDMAPYGELPIRGARIRTYDALAVRGLVERHLMQGWGKITPSGRAAVAPASSEGTEQ